MIKNRFAIASGLNGRESSWNVDNTPMVDFGAVTLAGAGIIRCAFNCLPLVNPAHAIGSPDNEPYELATLAAVSGTRQIGTSSAPIAILLNAYVVHVTSAAAVYNPAATATIRVRVGNANGITGGAFETVCSLVISGVTAPNFIDVVPMTVPADRQITLANNTIGCGMFNGDYWFAEFQTTNGGGETVVANILSVMLELA